VAEALRGDVSALRLLFERVEGRLPLASDLLDPDDVRIVQMPLAPPAEPAEGGDDAIRT